MVPNCGGDLSRFVQLAPLQVDVVTSYGLVGGWGDSASLSQASYLTPRSVQGYTDFFAALSTDVSGSIQDAYKSILIASIVGVLIGLLFGLCGCCFYAGRACYLSNENPTKKKKRQQRQFTEQPKKWITLVVVIGLSVSTLAVFFGSSVMITESVRLNRGVTALQQGLAASLADAKLALERTDATLQATVCSTRNTTAGLFNSLHAAKYATLLDSTVGNHVTDILGQLYSLEGDINSTTFDLTVLNASLALLAAQDELLRIEVATLSVDIDRLRTVRVANYTLDVPLPPTDDMNRLPRIPSNISNVESLLAAIDDIDFARRTRDIKTSYANASTTVVSVIQKAITRFNSTVDAGMRNALSSISFDSTGPNLQVGTLAQTMSMAWALYVSPAEGGRHALALIVASGLLLTFVVAVFGVLFLSSAMLKCVTVGILICGPLVWLQFSLYYLVAAPFNEGCLSVGMVMSQSFDLKLGETNLSIVPQRLIDDCGVGVSLFEMQLTGGNESFSRQFLGFDLKSSAPFLEELLADHGINVDTELNSLASGVIGDLPTLSISGDLSSSLMNLDLPTFNFSQYVPVFDSFDVPAKITTLQTASAGLSLASFGVDAGASQASLDDFNAVAGNWNASWASWSLLYFDTTYYLNRAQFQYTVVTKDPQGRDPIVTAFQATLAATTLQHQLANTILMVQSNISLIVHQLWNIQNHSLLAMREEVLEIETVIQRAAARKPRVLAKLDTLFYSINLTLASVDGFVSSLVNQTRTLVKSTLASLEISLRSRMLSIGECHFVEQDFNYLLAATCDYTLNSMSGQWAACVFAGVFLIASLVLVHCTCSRFERALSPLPSDGRYQYRPQPSRTSRASYSIDDPTGTPMYKNPAYRE